MRVPTRSAGTRSGVNWIRLNDPPSTSASVFTVSVLASPGTPSSSTWPPASRATITRSSIASWPTITRLISNSAVSSASCASRAGERRSSSESSARRRGSSPVTSRSPRSCTLSLCLFARAGAECDLEGLPAPIALHHDLHGIAGLACEHGLAQIGGGGDRPIVERDDQVAEAQAGPLRRRAGDLPHQRAVARGGVGG